MAPQQVVLPCPGLRDPARLSAGAAPAHGGWRIRPRDGGGSGPPARAHPTPDALLELVEGPARARRRLRAPTIVDARVPVRVLNWAWHRLEWPPVERFAGPVDIAHSTHPLLMPSRGGRQVVTIYDLDFLDHPERTRAEIRRDYARLAPRHARRADGGRDHLGVHRRRDRAPARRRRAIGSSSARPARPAWSPRPQPVPRGPILFVGTLEPRKNVGALLNAYAMLLERDAGGSAACGWREATTEASGPWLRAIGASRHWPGTCSIWDTSQRERSLCAVRPGVDAGAALALEGFGMTGARSDDGRRADDRQPIAARCRRWRRRRRCRRTGRHRGARRGDAAYLDDPAVAAGGAPSAASRRQRAYSWDASAANAARALPADPA